MFRVWRLKRIIGQHEWGRTILAALARVGNSPYILVLGDSVSLRVSREDRDTTSLEATLTERLKKLTGLEVVYLNGSALNPRVFYVFWTVVQALWSQPPKCVLLPVNLRSFSPQWERNKAWQFPEIFRTFFLARERRALKPAATEEDFLRPLAPLMSFYSRPHGLMTAEMIDTIVLEKQKFEPRDRYAFLFDYHYGQPVRDSANVRALDGLVRSVLASGARLASFVLPFNYQGMMRYLGQSSLEQVAEAVAFLTKMMEPHGLKLVDLSRTCGSESFFHPDDSTEHLNENGRSVLVSALEGEIFQTLGFPVER